MQSPEAVVYVLEVIFAAVVAVLVIKYAVKDAIKSALRERDNELAAFRRNNP